MLCAIKVYHYILNSKPLIDIHFVFVHTIIMQAFSFLS